MINKGLLNRPPISPLGSHKLTPAQNLPLTNDAPTLPQTSKVLAQNHPRVLAQPDQNGIRYTLSLKIEKDVFDKLGSLCGQTDADMQSPAKRIVMVKFREYVLALPIEKRRAVVLKKPAAIRFDIRLPEPLVKQIVLLEATAPLEPRSTILARYLAPRFADFMELW